METVFLSYGFTPDERDLAGLVEKLLESHDVRPVTGEVLEGEELTAAVKNKIDQTDALVAILVPRDDRPEGSKWVRDELVYAVGLKKPAIAIVYPGIELGGIIGNDENVRLDPADPVAAFLKLAQELGEWRRSRGRRVKVRVLPTDIEEEMEGLDVLPRCEYRLIEERDGGELRDLTPAKLTLEPGGAFVHLDGVPPHALIQLQVQFPDGRWTSRATPQWLHVELGRR